MKHYFVSYNLADKAWAEWVSQQVEALGMSVVMQAWDFEAGDNFVARMHAALQQCERMLLILSRHSRSTRASPTRNGRRRSPSASASSRCVSTIAVHPACWRRSPTSTCRRWTRPPRHRH